MTSLGVWIAFVFGQVGREMGYNGGVVFDEVFRHSVKNHVVGSQKEELVLDTVGRDSEPSLEPSTSSIGFMHSEQFQAFQSSPTREIRKSTRLPGTLSSISRAELAMILGTPWWV